jgi:bifunctional non-homologous end joining protein LigD
VAALPEPTLLRSGRLPERHGYAYELKWDGFRAIVRCGAVFRVRSRRGWNMTPRVPELAALPVGNAVLDGELVALGEDGWPDFPRVCPRLLSRLDSVYAFRLVPPKYRIGASFRPRPCI